MSHTSPLLPGFDIPKLTDHRRRGFPPPAMLRRSPGSSTALPWSAPTRRFPDGLPRFLERPQTAALRSPCRRWSPPLPRRAQHSLCRTPGGRAGTLRQRGALAPPVSDLGSLPLGEKTSPGLDLVKLAPRPLHLHAYQPAAPPSVLLTKTPCNFFKSTRGPSPFRKLKPSPFLI
jgi:hypothetical protein